MKKQKVIKEVLNIVGISDNRLDLIGRILNLREDKKRIHSIELYPNTIGYNGFSAYIYLLKNFKGLRDFRKYLTSKDLPTERTSKHDESYILQNEGVRSEFYVPEFFPKKND